MSKTIKIIGAWSFIIGVIIALVVGILSNFIQVELYMKSISIAILVIGLVVGGLNVSEKETTSFVIAAIGLTTGSVAVANIGVLIPGLGQMITTTFGIFGLFVAGALFVPSMKMVYKIAKDL